MVIGSLGGPVLISYWQQEHEKRLAEYAGAALYSRRLLEDTMAQLRLYTRKRYKTPASNK